MHRTQSPSTEISIGAFENGVRIQAIFIHHPQRELHEVHYARCVGSACDSALPFLRRGLLVAKRFASRIGEVIDREWSGIGTNLTIHAADSPRSERPVRVGPFLTQSGHSGTQSSTPRPGAGHE